MRNIWVSVIIVNEISLLRNSLNRSIRMHP